MRSSAGSSTQTQKNPYRPWAKAEAANTVGGLREDRHHEDSPSTTSHNNSSAEPDPKIQQESDKWASGTVDPMALSDCYFETERLVVDDWSRLLAGGTTDVLRDRFVVSLLTEAVTRDLPPGWQGPYNTDRAASWFADRQSDGTVLLIVNRSNGLPVGLMLLSEALRSDSSVDIRLGYMIVENSWGTGLATEVVAGMVDWCRRDGDRKSVV